MLESHLVTVASTALTVTPGCAWQNPADPLDVLMIINRLNDPAPVESAALTVVFAGVNDTADETLPGDDGLPLAEADWLSPAEADWPLPTLDGLQPATDAPILTSQDQPAEDRRRIRGTCSTCSRKTCWRRRDNALV